MTTFPEIPSIVLSNSVSIPQIGFGTYRIRPAETQKAVETALSVGYRHIDTAAAYYNEAGVGAAIKHSAIARNDIFITTKIRNIDHGRDAALKAFDASRQELGVDVIDLYLIHWPAPGNDLYVETWSAFKELLDEGGVRAIGVSNFLPDQLARLVGETGVVPHINQVEVHPSFSQPAVLEACARNGVTVEAYSPLGHGEDLTEPTIAALAQRLGVTPAQVILKWHLQRGRVVIPKSTHSERMRANLEVGSFELSAEEMDAIDTCHRQDGRTGGDPATLNSPQTREDVNARGGNLD